LAFVAFSLTSFANEVENKNVVEPFKEVATTELTNSTMDDGCVDVTITWVTSETIFDEEYGVQGVSITRHKLEFTICI
jgi:hypothetical protein